MINVQNKARTDPPLTKAEVQPYVLCLVKLTAPAPLISPALCGTVVVKGLIASS